MIDSTIGERDVAVLAVTVMPGPQLAQAVPLCRDLKQRHPGLFVVWGGYFPTQHYDACLAAPYVDFVLRGYGEVAFRNLVDTLAAGEQIKSIAGLVYRDPATGAIVANPPAACAGSGRWLQTSPMPECRWIATFDARLWATALASSFELRLPLRL